MSRQINAWVAVVGIDIANNSFHIVGRDSRKKLFCGRSDRAATLRLCSPICRPV
jgi:hypothetical protein